MSSRWIKIAFSFLLLISPTPTLSTAANDEFITKLRTNETKSGKYFICVVWRGKINIFVFKAISVKIGQSEVPDARPKVDDRLFISETVEAVILDVGSRIKDDTIRTIFTNCLPSTLGKNKLIKMTITHR